MSSGQYWLLSAQVAFVGLWVSLGAVVPLIFLCVWCLFFALLFTVVRSK